jgi:site-specific recombinase
MNNQTIVITIEKIENDSIYFKTRSEEAKTSDPANNSITPLAKTMLFISFCGLFLYCCSILLRKKSLNNI